MHVVYEDLLEAIKEMKVLDTHEHLESEEERVRRPLDVFNTFLMHYASCDLVSAGMSHRDMAFLKSDDSNLTRKWEIFAPYWDKARNTAYCKSLLIAARDIYEVDDIRADTWQVLDTKMKERNQKGLYHHILKDMCGIVVSILDGNPECDRDYFIPAVRFDRYVTLGSKDIITEVERRFNLSINSLSDWVSFLKREVKSVMEHYGLACIKTGLAYNRMLKYERTEYGAADKVFTRLLSTDSFTDWYSYSPLGREAKPLEDYLMHVLIQTAGELDLPVQIHTGLQEGNGNYLYNSNPIHLNNLFMEYPKTRFDIFHAGYPYGGELCALAKNFPNVYVDLCWSHLISREYTVNFIEEMLEAVPANKLFGFGGDYLFVEGVYGHLIMARENIARALANKVQKGYLTHGEAERIAKWMLYDNAAAFFHL